MNFARIADFNLCLFDLEIEGQCQGQGQGRADWMQN